MRLVDGSSMLISLLLLTGCSGTIGGEQPDLSTAMYDDVTDPPTGAGDQGSSGTVEIGREVAVPDHLADGEELEVSLRVLLAHGERIFAAVWTEQEGGGRPLTKGVGTPLSDPTSPLVFPRNMNRLSAPDSNSCAGCHAQPFGIRGGGGDFVTSAFVLAHRFDFATFDHADTIVGRGALMENGEFAQLESISDSRATIGMFGSGFIEMLARQITVDLISIRDRLEPGQTAALVSTGVSFGALTRRADGTWDASAVEGLSPPSVATSGAEPPSLIVRPFFQTGATISLRQFTNDALNHHHGIQSSERFGPGPTRTAMASWTRRPARTSPRWSSSRPRWRCPAASSRTTGRSSRRSSWASGASTRWAAPPATYRASRLSIRAGSSGSRTRSIRPTTCAPATLRRSSST
jgi:hypothetical protein